jgi:serine phosphatase RsbU (regulator of sigma subunit)
MTPETNLNAVPLFKSLPPETLASITKTYKTWSAPAGSHVLEEGNPGDEFYVILQGRVEIVRAIGTPEESFLGMRYQGEFIGEVGLLNQGAPRTATARVVEDAQLMTVKYSDFNELLKIHPELAYEMASALSARLTESLNETIRNLRGKNEELQKAYDDLRAAQEQIIEKEKLEHSLKLARKIQYSILPNEIPQMEGYDIGALMIPAQAVGGDFYGVYKLDDENMALIVGDVSDKGVPSAIFMAQCHALLRASIGIDVGTLDVIKRVNSLICEMNASGLFVTVIYGVLNKPTGVFRYVRAGHELPLILDARGEATLPEMGKSMVLGIFDDPLLEERQITIPPDGLMLLYSDGVADARFKDDSPFGMEGLIQTLKRLGTRTPARALCEGIFDSALAFQKGSPQFDDITLLAVRRPG